MAKHCIECGHKVGGFFFGRSYETCRDCGEYVCCECHKERDGKYYCQRCYRKSQGGCFIATACYGYSSKEVNILRVWRDECLMKSKGGVKFVDTYYKISPPIANFISDKPFLKDVVRLGLNPIVKTIKFKKMRKLK